MCPARSDMHHHHMPRIGHSRRSPRYRAGEHSRVPGAARTGPPGAVAAEADRRRGGGRERCGQPNLDCRVADRRTGHVDTEDVRGRRGCRGGPGVRAWQQRRHGEREQAGGNDRAKHDCRPVEGADQGASPFGSPADLEGPVALRPHLAMGLPLSLTPSASAAAQPSRLARTGEAVALVGAGCSVVGRCPTLRRWSEPRSPFLPSPVSSPGGSPARVLGCSRSTAVPA